jgi:hypothetical protein
VDFSRLRKPGRIHGLVQEACICLWKIVLELLKELINKEFSDALLELPERKVIRRNPWAAQHWRCTKQGVDEPKEAVLKTLMFSADGFKVNCHASREKGWINHKPST